MREVGVQEAKTQLSRLLLELEGGTEFVILRSGRPVARLVTGDAGHLRSLGNLGGVAIVSLSALLEATGP